MNEHIGFRRPQHASATVFLITVVVFVFALKRTFLLPAFSAHFVGPLLFLPLLFCHLWPQSEKKVKAAAKGKAAAAAAEVFGKDKGNGKGREKGKEGPEIKNWNETNRQLMKSSLH